MNAFPEPGNTAVKLFREFYHDSFRRSAIGYSENEELQARCASGGLVSTLLARRIETGTTNGAIVARVTFGPDGPAPETFLAIDPEQVFSSSGSIYSDFDHIEGIRKILSDCDGVFDVVALPCQIRRLRSILDKNDHLRKKTGLLVGLWCGHATDRRLLQDLLPLWGIKPDSVQSFSYRRGRWRGRSEIVLNDGSVIKKPFSKNYGLFQNMYVDCMPRCFSCTDHFAESADISFGDCWISSEKKEEYKKTMVLSLTEPGDSALELLLASSGTVLETVEPVLAVQAQKRAAVWHTYSCKARAVIGKQFGLNISCSLDVKPRLNDYISAYMILFSYRLFNTRFRKILLRLPWWMMYPSMAIQKLMLNR